MTGTALPSPQTHQGELGAHLPGIPALVPRSEMELGHQWPQPRQPGDLGSLGFTHSGNPLSMPAGQIPVD
ncbi:unnamed protein product [Boreogadus saida]